MEQPLLGYVCPQPGHKRRVVVARCPVCEKSMTREIGGSATCSEVCQEKLKFKKNGNLIKLPKYQCKGLSKKAKRKKRRKERNALKRAQPKEDWKKFKAESKRLKSTYGDTFYTSPEWRVLRYGRIKLSKGKCEACGRSPKEHGIAIHIDHIKPRSKYPELELSLNNTQALCEDCNLGKSNKDETDWR